MMLVKVGLAKQLVMDYVVSKFLTTVAMRGL